jgi:glycogen debranching enzyme
LESNTHPRFVRLKKHKAGGRPTPMDNPIKLKSIINNVGFEIDGVNLLQKIIQDRKAKTFLRKA